MDVKRDRANASCLCSAHIDCTRSRRKCENVAFFHRPRAQPRNIIGRRGSFTAAAKNRTCALTQKCNNGSEFRIVVKRVPTRCSLQMVLPAVLAMPHICLRLGAYWQLNCCGDTTVAVNVRALQPNSCLYWQLFLFSVQNGLHRDSTCMYSSA